MCAPRVSLRIETTCKSGGTRSCSVLMSYCACILLLLCVCWHPAHRGWRGIFWPMPKNKKKRWRASFAERPFSFPLFSQYFSLVWPPSKVGKSCWTNHTRGPRRRYTRPREDFGYRERLQAIWNYLPARYSNIIIMQLLYFDCHLHLLDWSFLWFFLLMCLHFSS